MAAVPYSGAPDVFQGSAVPDDYQHEQASPAAFGGAIAQGAEKLGAGAQQLGSGLLDVNKFWGQIQTSAALNNGYKDWTDAAEKYKALQGQDALDNQQSAKDNIEKMVQSQRDALPTDFQKLQFDQESRSFLNRFIYPQIATHANQQALEYATKNNTNGANQWLSVVASSADNPENAEAARQGMLQAVGKNAHLVLGDGASDQDVDAYMRPYLQKSYEVQAQALAAKNPQAAMQFVNDNQDKLGTAYAPLAEQLKGVTNQNMGTQAAIQAATQFPTDRAKAYGAVQTQFQDNPSALNAAFASLNDHFRVQDFAEAAQDKAAAATRVNITHGVNDDLARMRDGLPPQYVASLTDSHVLGADPKKTGWSDEMVETVSALRASSEAISRFPIMTPEQITQTVNAAKPDPNSPHYAKDAKVYHLLQTAAQGQIQGLADDPAARMLATATAHPDITQAWGAVQQNKDPQAFPTAFADYAEKTLGAQEVAGVPQASRSLLPTDVATREAAHITANPGNAPQTIQAMRQQYGVYFPQVWQDVVKRGGLPPAYEYVGGLDDPRDGAQLAQWIQGGKDQKRNVSDLVGGQDAYNNINKYVDTDPSVQQLIRSMYASNTSQQKIGDTVQSIKDLAYAKAAQTGSGAQNSAAAKSAVDAFTKGFDFSLPGGARVPVKNLDAVQQNIAAFQRTMDIAIPPGYSTGFRGQPTPEDYKNLVRGSAVWVNNQNGNGILMMDPHGAFVRDRQGKPIQILFNAVPPAVPPASEDLATGPL